MDKHSRIGLWDAGYAGNPPRAVYGDPLTLTMAAAFLDRPEIVTVEDWGCGLGGCRDFLRADQRYVGIDGSHSPHADRIADLECYTSDVDAIHMRHVLEHNPGWERILTNALASFRRRMVLTLFTPWTEHTCVLAEYPNFLGTGVTMVDIAFCRADIVAHFGEINWRAEENLVTRTQYGVEHVFFLERPLP